MLRVCFGYGDKTIEISPYTTVQEKDLLLLCTISQGNINSALKICNIPVMVVENLSEYEKYALMYKLREISVGSEISVDVNCTNCKITTDNNIDIENICVSSTEDQHVTKYIEYEKMYDVHDQYTLVTYENLHKYLNVDEQHIQNLDLSDCEELIKYVKHKCVQYEFSRPVHCQKCGTINYIDVDDVDFCLDSMSEITLIGLYQSYNDLIFHGKYTKQDIDSMYPFERIIFTQMLNQTQEDLNNA